MTIEWHNPKPKTLPMKTIRIAGVPEHFNLPWQMAIEKGSFEKKGIDLQWTNVPEGTGKMCQMLRNGDTDIAVILTEGIVKDVVAGNPCKIVQVYVESPLIWGIHVAAQSKYHTLDDLKNTKAAISRYGSGSHLMAYINAENQGWDIEKLQFEVVNTIEGAAEALTNQTADYFMWERFMTQPLVDKGVFRRVADCPTPWPCFVIAVRNELLETHPESVRHLLETINQTTAAFKETPDLVRKLCHNYHLKQQDAIEWLGLTEWSQNPLSEAMVSKIQNQLFGLGIIDKSLTFASIVKAV